MYRSRANSKRMKSQQVPVTNIGWPPLGARTGGFESVQDAERRFGDIGLQSLCRKEAQ
jgi:hypothetical protein